MSIRKKCNLNYQLQLKDVQFSSFRSFFYRVAN